MIICTFEKPLHGIPCMYVYEYVNDKSTPGAHVSAPIWYE